MNGWAVLDDFVGAILVLGIVLAIFTDFWNNLFKR
jgi:hypothetical protein